MKSYSNKNCKCHSKFTNIKLQKNMLCLTEELGNLLSAATHSDFLFQAYGLKQAQTIWAIGLLMPLEAPIQLETKWFTLAGSSWTT